LNRYFWLLARFVSDVQSFEERQAVYERARSALLHQLLEADPTGTGDHAAFERLSFEEAVRTVEAALARWGQHQRGP
jgi:hypothetical protein